VKGEGFRVGLGFGVEGFGDWGWFRVWGSGIMACGFIRV
jgi:hypothetical protein